MPDILIPLLVLSAVGILCAALLVVAAKYFSTEENSEVIALRDCLPGANCGACGFSGCDAYAKALAEGETDKTNLCVPGGDKTARDIAEILGTEAEDVEELVAYVACGGTCATAHKTLDSRHIVLGGSLLSAAIFGFPVFCLVCPIGLSFAFIFFLVRAFGFGDPSWALIIIPVVLILELVVFRKWCHWICPVSALMSLVAKGNKTVLPVVDESKCLESAKGVSCSACAHVCPEGINLHDPESVKASLNECTSCHACVDVCPTGALSIKFLAGKASAKAEKEPVEAE